MTGAITQEWFEMADLRRRLFINSVWIPLRAVETTKRDGGGEEIFASGSVAFPPTERANAERLGWSDLGLLHSGGPYAFRDHPYKPAEVYQYRDGEDMGVNLVFEQHLGNGHANVWHLNQDLVMALGLLQEGDSWVRPDEDYIEVVRQRRSADGPICAIEIRAEFLRDYLAARGLALRVAYYRQRTAILEDASYIQWVKDGINDDKPHDRFNARVFEVDENGAPYGGGIAVVHAWRTDVDPEEDVPIFGREGDENTASTSASYTRAGPKFYRVEGELWREEWIDPSERSERVRGDDSAEVISYIINAAGQRSPNSVLKHEDVGRYLWFDPRVMQALIGRRGGGLQWYTEQTGSVWASPDWQTHFGLNRLGLLNVYAYDIARLPVWQQRIWGGYNISPDGAVSNELLNAQMKARPARSIAPESRLPDVLNELDMAVHEWLGAPLFQKHDAVVDIVRSVHRFRALEQDGILILSKDVARLTADRIAVATLRKIAVPPKNERWGSLTSLEHALASIVSPGDARKLLTPLVGLYGLRVGTAHLPSRRIEESYDLVGINPKANPIDQGRQLLEITVTALANIRDAIKSRVRAAGCDGADG
jgi:hypothetical protein